MINLKVRLKNKVFLTTFTTTVIAFVYQMLALFDIVPPITQDKVIELLGLVFTLLGGFGVLHDPTTKGFRDSERAMTYAKPK